MNDFRIIGQHFDELWETARAARQRNEQRGLTCRGNESHFGYESVQVAGALLLRNRTSQLQKDQLLDTIRMWNAHDKFPESSHATAAWQSVAAAAVAAALPAACATDAKLRELFELVDDVIPAHADYFAFLLPRLEAVADTNWARTFVDLHARSDDEVIAGTREAGAGGDATALCYLDRGLSPAQIRRDMFMQMLRAGADGDYWFRGMSPEGRWPRFPPALRDAAVGGNAVQVLAWLQAGGSVDARESGRADGDVDPRERQRHSGPTLLHLACGAGQVALASALIRRGARRDALDQSTGMTPLMHAVVGGSLPALSLLLDARADPTLEIDGEPPDGRLNARDLLEVGAPPRDAPAMARLLDEATGGWAAYASGGHPDTDVDASSDDSEASGPEAAALGGDPLRAKKTR